MSRMNNAPNTEPHRPSAAEQTADFLADELTEMRARCATLARTLESACEENRAKRIKLNTIADRIATARDLVREGRCGNASALLEDLIKLARAL